MATDTCDVTEGLSRACAATPGGLADVADGLIAVDTCARIMGMNPAAREMLGAGLDELVGQPVLDAVASPTLSTLILGALISPGQCEGRAAVCGEPEQRVLARAEPLTDERGAAVGGLLILTVEAS